MQTARRMMADEHPGKAIAVYEHDDPMDPDSTDQHEVPAEHFGRHGTVRTLGKATRKSEGDAIGVGTQLKDLRGKGTEYLVHPPGHPLAGQVNLKFHEGNLMGSPAPGGAKAPGSEEPTLVTEKNSEDDSFVAMSGSGTPGVMGVEAYARVRGDMSTRRVKARGLRVLEAARKSVMEKIATAGGSGGSSSPGSLTGGAALGAESIVGSTYARERESDRRRRVLDSIPPRVRGLFEKAMDETLMKPYMSLAQERWAHTDSGERALGGPAKVREWDEATRGKKLPERVSKSEGATGPLKPAGEMREFQLLRHRDLSGNSGTGVVAQGVEFGDGTACLRWLTQTASTAIYASMADLEMLHSHGGATEVVWLDKAGEPPSGRVRKSLEALRAKAKRG
jgi:hypothetical protein